jgi:hypothetical protein
LAHGDLGDSLRFARAAREPHWKLSPGGIACSALLEVRTCALAGDVEGLLRALDLAEEAYDNLDLGAEPPWLYWLGGTLDLRRDAVRLLREGPDAAAPMEATLTTSRPNDSGTQPGIGLISPWSTLRRMTWRARCVTPRSPPS